MDKGLALARLNLMLKKQHAEWRHRMIYLATQLGWNWPTRVVIGRGGRRIFLQILSVICFLASFTLFCSFK